MNFQKQPFEFQPAKQTRLAKKLSQVNPADTECSTNLSLQNHHSMESEVSQSKNYQKTNQYEIRL